MYVHDINTPLMGDRLKNIIARERTNTQTLKKGR